MIELIKLKSFLFYGSILALGLIGGILVGALQIGKPETRSIAIEAQRYSYDPPIIRVKRGDRIEITLSSKDVAHGFYLEGYDLDARIFPPQEVLLGRPSQKGEYKRVKTISFTADKVGKFRYRCSLTCGYLHPFMLGELIVEPNYPYTGGLGLLVGITVASVLYLARKEESDEEEDRLI